MIPQYPGGDPRAATRVGAGWRTVDILVTAIIGVVFGVVFWVWSNVVWVGLTPLGPFANLFYGPWLIPAVLAPMVVRRPGAGILAEALAASVSVLLVNQWGPVILLYGVVQGLAGELPFFATRYRSIGWPVVIPASVLAMVAAWLLDWAIYYQAVAVDYQLLVGALMVASGVVIVAGGSVFLIRALRQAGVLQQFEGRRA
jgi:energy-coupling factor transport system permease protein